MNTKLMMTLAAASLISLTACSGMSGRQVDTAVGAVAGGAIGNAVIGGPIGVIGGAAAGALIGNEVGKK